MGVAVRWGIDDDEEGLVESVGRVVVAPILGAQVDGGVVRDPPGGERGELGRSVVGEGDVVTDQRHGAHVGDERDGEG